MHKNWDSVFTVKVTERAYIIKNMMVSTVSCISSKLMSFEAKLGLMIDHRKKKSVQRKHWIAAFTVTVTAKVKHLN